MTSQTQNHLETPSQEAEPTVSPTPDSHNLDRAIDTLGAFLRDFGKYAFDLADLDAGTVNTLCEKWAQHVLFAVPPPNVLSPSPESTGGKRDWAGLRTFVANHRRNEQAYVLNSLSGLQQIVWTCIREFNQAILGDQHAEGHLHVQIERLQTAVHSHSIEEMKREVLAVVSEMNRVLEERKRQHQHQMEDLYAQIRELDHLLQEARQESCLDPLTQLYNRKALDNHLARTLDLCTVFQEPACLLLIDVDHFKRINDVFGHTTGDAVLRALADCLVSTFPRKGDCIARYGGEEFAVLFHDTSARDGRKLGERLLRAVRALPIAHNGQALSITISIGLSEAQPEDSVVGWLERTDRALYAAKNNGRDCMEER